MHRLLGMELVQQLPPVTVLPVHLEGQAQVVLEERMDVEQVEALLDSLKLSKLEAYFKFHQSSFPLALQSEPRPFYYHGEVHCPCSQPGIALRLQSPTYASFGANMRWDGAKHGWHPYQRAHCSTARVHMGACLANRFVPLMPKLICLLLPAVTFSEEAKERFALRALLAHVPAPQCYADLRVDLAAGDMIVATFHEAAVAHDFLSTDAFWFEAFNESATRTGNWHWNCFNAACTTHLRLFGNFCLPYGQTLGAKAACLQMPRLQGLHFRGGTTLERAGLGELTVHLNAAVAKCDGGEEFQSMDDRLAALPDVELNAGQAAFRDHFLGLLQAEFHGPEDDQRG